MPSPSSHDYSPAAAVLYDERFAVYLSISSLTFYAYDWLSSILDEVEIVSARGVSWPIAIYWLSRVVELGHLLTWAGIAIFKSPTQNCTVLATTLGVFAVMSIGSTSFLFLLRVRAVYLQSRTISVLFGALWLVTISLNITASALFSAESVSRGCNIAGLNSALLSLPNISTALNDTSIFLAISYRLAADFAPLGSWSSLLLSAVKGKGLYRLSKSLMYSGQLYYCATIFFFFVNLAVIWSPLVPASSHYILVVPCIAFTNMMACHVFRGVALGTIHTEHPSATTIEYELEPLPFGTHESQ